jgi:hypothetical protein
VLLEPGVVPGRGEGVDLVEDEDGRGVAPGPGEGLPDAPLGLAYPLGPVRQPKGQSFVLPEEI